MAKELKNNLWVGGVPYAPDVRKLRDKYPDPEEGLVIKHEEFEELTHEKRGTQRYYGVINSWRKYLKNELGIVTAWETGVGVKVLEPVERLEHAEFGLRSGFKKTARGVDSFRWVERDRLDDLGKARYDHQREIVSKTMRFVHETSKQLAVEIAPIKSLPKPRIVRSKEGLE